ncbi:MAG: DUF4143 domain-containing protein, partial [Fidelibacterota bacterium]
LMKHVRGGAIAEAFVGQELTALTDASPVNPLVYWHRESKSSSAEVDYVINYQGEVTPVEVKEGTTGRLKSLKLFMSEKKSKSGIKISSQNFHTDKNIQCIPLYAVARLFT